MTRLIAMLRGLSGPKLAALAAGIVLLLGGAGVAAYVVLKRDSDQSCAPPCKLEVQKPTRHREEVKTVDWPYYGYDQQRTRYLPTKRVRPPYDASNWSLQVGKLIEFAPIVAKGTLYFQDKNAVFYAVDADTGKVLWKKRIGALGAASPGYSHGVVYAVTLQTAPGVDQGEALAMRAKDGKLLWRFEFPGRSETSPVIAGRNVFVGSESGDIYGLDRKDGRVDWHVSTDGEVKGGLALDGGVLYGGNYAGQVFAIRASNGQFVWQSSTQGLSLGRGGSVYSTPAAAFGRIFLGSIDNRVYSFDQDTGDLLWSHSTGDWVYAAPAVADTPRAGPTVYVGSKDQNFYALDAKTGEVRWQKDLGGVILGAGTVLGEVVYVAALGPNVGTLGFDAKTGHKVFDSDLGEYNPVISDGARLYLTGTTGIRAFEHETEAERKREAQRRQAKRERQQAAHRAKRKRQEAAHRGARQDEKGNQGGGRKRK
ncbi:MAG TPA: PQQ-binding-like beta-propeller repeat protein [Solirubrobacterales bacterium]|nr:PQQ-binding-like beta-propeller repeat protein [Solirubrobacterales bacterium]